MTTLFACLFVVCVAGRAALAQPPPTAFEVATVKLLPPLPVGTPLPTIILALYRNGSLTMSNVTLSEALRFAYDLTTDDQVSGPDWITSRGTRYEVVAKTAGDVTLVQASGGSKLVDGTHHRIEHDVAVCAAAVDLRAPDDSRQNGPDRPVSDQTWSI